MSGSRKQFAVSPRARRALGERGLEAAQVRGSGPGGRIVEADVLRAAAGTVRGASSMRQSIARRTSRSFAEAPHFYLEAELDATQVLACRERLLPPVERESGVRLSVSDLLLMALAKGLRDSPRANCIWQGQEIIELPAVDVGIVVSLDDGLLLPVIRNADQLPAIEMARRRSALAAAARRGRLGAADLGGGASSLSNLGRSRIDRFAAVLASPQSSMLTAGRIAPRPWVVDGALAVRPTLRLTLSVDHRVLDGSPAADFLGRIVECLERPELLPL